MTVFGQIAGRWVRTSEQCDKDCQDASLRFSRFLDAYQSARRRIALAAQDGHDLGNGTRLIRTQGGPSANIPALTVLYSYDADNIYLLRLKAE
jgi:hypothetical protein